VWKSGPSSRGARRTLSNDASLTSRFVSVRRDGLVSFAVPITLYGKAELAAHHRQLGERDISEFWTSHAEIAETEEETVGVEFCKEPGALCVRREEFEDRLEVDGVVALIDRLSLCSAVGEKLFGE
jgi:hypothetical protein